MYRKVTTGLWLDPKVEELSGEATYVWLYLLTSPSGNIAGCYEVTRRRIARETKLDEDTVSAALDELSDTNVIAYSDVTNEVLVKNWRKYNWTKSKKLVKPITEAIETVKDPNFRAFLESAFSEWFEIPYQHTTDTVSKGYGYDSVSVSVTDSKGIQVDKSTSKTSQVGTGKHRHGEFGNVLLTDYELEQLKAKFPSDWQERIDNLSYYIGSKGDKYKSHYRTILSWDRRDSKAAPKGEVKLDARYAKYD